MSSTETKGKSAFVEKLRRHIDRYITFRRVEIQRRNVKRTMWLTIRQAIIHIFTTTILTLVMLDLSSENYYTVVAFEQAFSGGEKGLLHLKLMLEFNLIKDLAVCTVGMSATVAPKNSRFRLPNSIRRLSDSQVRFNYRPREGHPEPRVAVRLTLANVTNTLAFWDYITTQFVPLYTSRGIKPAILEVNHFLGLARIRQLRVDGDSCVLEKVLRKYISHCYGFLRFPKEDEKPFGPGTPTAWVYSPPEITGYSSYIGHFGEYGGGGYYVDLPQDFDRAIDLVNELKEKGWITRQTRYVFAHVCMYNFNSNHFYTLKVDFEFSPVGRIISSVHTYKVNTIDANNQYNYFLTACRIYFVAYVLSLTIGQLLQMIQFGRSYLLMIGYYVELILLCFSWLFIGFDCVYWYSATQFRQMGPDHHCCADLHKLRNHLDISIVTGSIALLLLVMLSLEFLDFGGSSALSYTLLSSLCDILSFGVVFLFTIFVFSVASYIVFGHSVEGMRGLRHAFFTLSNAVLRSFDYRALLEASRTFAPVFFILFTFLIIFVVCNLFVVILNDTYFDVRSRGIGSNSPYHFRSFLAHGFSNIARKMRLPIWGKKTQPPGLSYQCVRSLFHIAWVHWPEMRAFFNREKVKEAAVKNSLDDFCVADVPKLKFGYLKEAYWEDFERLLLRMNVIKMNIYQADSFIAPLVSKNAPQRFTGISEEQEEL